MKKIIGLFLFAIFLIPASVLAHVGENVLEDGEYRIELGSFPEADLQPRQTILFSTILETIDAEPIYETKAWVRISQGNEILFSSADLETDDGTIDFEYFFPDHGEYEMTVRMINLNNDDEATVTFPLEVGDLSLGGEILGESVSEQKKSRFNLAALTLIIGLLSGVFIARYRPKVTEVK